MAAVDVNSDSAQMRWLPVALFGSVMGLTGLSLAWRLAHAHFGTPIWIAQGIGILAITAFVAMTTGYAIKALTGFSHVRAEFNHPVAGALFGTPLISALLLPAILADMNQLLARALWIAGAVGMTIFAWHMAGRWLGVGQQRPHATPAWMVPLVGMLDIPLAVPALGFSEPPHVVMMLGLSVGLFFAIPLFTIIFSRLMFEEPLAPAMSPSLLIMLAPFAVGFSSYVTTIGRMDALAEGLFGIALFMFAVLLTRLKQLRSCCPFRVSWWSVSFPLAALAGASVRYASITQALWSDVMAAGLLAFASAIIGGLFVRTMSGIVKNDLQKLSG
ncbi:MAG TPA: SLAC1 anion channel family protein [Aquabacterium sp.]|nr:SLAC1 anion channel family protein [Aquabacterium sp.]